MDKFRALHERSIKEITKITIEGSKVSLREAQTIIYNCLEEANRLKEELGNMDSTSSGALAYGNVCMWVDLLTDLTPYKSLDLLKIKMTYYNYGFIFGASYR